MGRVQVNTLGGDDSLTVAIGAGNFIDALIGYDGGTGSDTLTVVSTADLLRAYSTEPDAGSVAKQGIATAVQQVPVTCEGSMALTLACERMVRARTHQLLVVDGGRLVGVLSSTDVVRAVACIDDLRKSGRFKTDAGAASDATST